MIVKKGLKWILLLMLSCFLMGCSDNNVKVKQSAYSDVTENEEYKSVLTEREAFRDILQDFIYWEYATTIEKDGESFFSRLEEENCIEKELKLHFYYCELEEVKAMNNIYDIVVTFPDNKKLSYLSLNYNVRGLSSEYEYGYDRWFSDNLEEGISSQELEKNEWFQKHYVSIGETSLILKKEDAENYKVKSKFTDGDKEKILSAIHETIQEEYKKSNNLFIYIRDFLPGDQSLSGKVVNLDITDRDDMPLYYIDSSLNFTGNNMEKFKDISWYIHYSTGYSGASNPDYNPTIKQLKKWAKEEKEAINVEKCILAYHVKDGKVIALKEVDEKNQDNLEEYLN